MRVSGAGYIVRNMRKHPQLREPLNAWLRVANEATWQNLMEVRAVFPTADGVPIRKGKRTVVVTVFNIGGNSFRLITTLSYAAQAIDVWGVLTHAEYDKEQWKRWFA